MSNGTLLSHYFALELGDLRTIYREIDELQVENASCSRGGRAKGGSHGRSMRLWNQGSIRISAPGLYPVRGRLLPKLFVPVGVHPLLRRLRRKAARAAVGPGAPRAIFLR